MAKLMWIAGIVLVAVGVALGLMIFFSPASIVSWGINPEATAIIIVGGILSVGLGGVINAIETARPAAMVMHSPMPDIAEAPAADIPEFGRRLTEVAAVAVVAEPVSSEVQETINALEQAKKNIQQAFEPEAAPVVTPAEPEATAESQDDVDDEATAEEPAEAAAEEEPAAEGQLYVVEERTIRNRPARVLSDGTVEAETDEGWMRFENLEHLDEYLEATALTGRA